MPRVSVVLPAALSPAMASMTGRGGSGTDSLRRSRISLSGIGLLASAWTRPVRLSTLGGSARRHLPRSGDIRAKAPQVRR